MWIITKKLARLLLILAIAGSSTQALYAASFHKYEHHLDMGTQHSQQAEPCCDDNCICDAKFTVQASLPGDLALLQYGFSQTETLSDMMPQYTQHFYNPLLRPPIS